MTGRYSYNTGQPFASLHGSVNGLPEGMPTMPQLLKNAGYSPTLWLEHIVTPEVAQTLHGKSKICVFTTQQISGLENEVETSKPMREGA